MTLAIETRALTKRDRKVVALDSLDLAIEQGEIFGYLGPNGAGLTVLLGPTSATGTVGGSPRDDPLVAPGGRGDHRW
jgi:ABC-2 type transport system ATP-binding protein